MKTREHWRAEANELWERGLTRRGQRNEALFSLSIDLASRGVPREDAVEELRRWLSEKNNGVSATFNRDVGVAMRDIEPIIATVYQRCRRRSAATWGSPHSLTEYEARTILTVLEDEEARTDPATGELIERYELERFLFEVVRRAKEWIAVQAVRASRARYPLPASIWPDHDRAEFIVQVPKDMRRKIRGFGRHRDVDLWRTLVVRETLRRVQGSSAKAGRGARYSMILDFGALSECDMEFHTLAAALTKLMTPAMMERRYGAEGLACINSDAAAAAAPVKEREPLPHELFVRERLRAARRNARRQA